MDLRIITVTEEGKTVTIRQTEAPRVITVTTGPRGAAGSGEGGSGTQGPPGPAGANGAPGANGTSATISVGTVTTGAAGSNATITNVGTSSNAVFNFVIPRGAQGVQGLPGANGANGADGAPGANGANGADGQQGPKGDDGEQGPPGANGANGADGAPGAAATISVGTVTTGAAGSNAVVTNAGNSSVATFNFTIPRGATGNTGANGATGAAATITVGTVTTGSPGSSVVITNAGNSSAATLNFTIPRGDTGTAGANGTNGSPGANGMSAYQVAVVNGFVGTELEWLDSLAYGDPQQGTWNMTHLANPPKIWFDFDQATSNIVTTATLSQVPTLITSQFNPAYTANTDLCILQAQNANFGLRRTLHLLGSGSRINVQGANSLFKAKMKHTQIILMRMFTEGTGAPGTQTPYVFVGGNGSGVARHSLGQTASSVASLRMGGRAADGDTFDGNDYTGNLGSMPILAFAEWDHTVGRKRLWLWGELIGEDTGYFTTATANTDSSYIGIGSFTSTQTGNPNWEVAVVGIHDDVYTTDERQRIEGMLARRARLSHYLVAGHPYKDTPPMV